jgi:hypothetical protein
MGVEPAIRNRAADPAGRQPVISVEPRLAGAQNARYGAPLTTSQSTPSAVHIGGSVSGLLGLPLLLRVMPSSEEPEADLRVGSVRPVCSRSPSVVGPGMPSAAPCLTQRAVCDMTERSERASAYALAVVDLPVWVPDWVHECCGTARGVGETVDLQLTFAGDTVPAAGPDSVEVLDKGRVSVVGEATGLPGVAEGNHTQGTRIASGCMKFALAGTHPRPG